MTKGHKTFLIWTLGIFLLLLPIATSINYRQNDDWNRYRTVMSFMKGDFTLLPVTATTFYSQGFLGLIFAMSFGIQRLPVLTLIVSVLNFLVFTLILHKFYLKNKFLILLIGLVFFFTPLHLYSAWGFMTENYFLLFTLIATFFYLRFFAENKDLDFFNANFFSLMAFFAKQIGIISMIAAVPYLFLKGHIKKAVIQIGFVTLTLGFYYLLFPQTPEMTTDKALNFQNLANLNYTYSLVYALISNLSVYLMPLVVGVGAMVLWEMRKNLTKITLMLGISIFALLFAYKAFDATQLKWQKFPYLANTFEREGFYPHNIKGTRYSMENSDLLFDSLGEVSKVLVGFFVGLVVYGLVSRKQAPYLVFYLVAYISVLITAPSIYDRYLLPLIPVGAMLLLDFYKLDVRLHSILCSGFLVFLIFIGYQFTMDFITLNSVVWSTSHKIAAERNILPNRIYATQAWRKYYPTKNTKIWFSYDSPKKYPQHETKFKLIDKVFVTFPGSLFKNSVLYVYENIPSTEFEPY